MYLDVKAIDGEAVASFKWDENSETVKLNMQVDNDVYKSIMESILEQDGFFDPDSEGYIKDKSLDFFDGFVNKAVPTLTQYGFRYELK